jgi:hypothetical protein
MSGNAIADYVCASLREYASCRRLETELGLEHGKYSLMQLEGIRAIRKYPISGYETHPSRKIPGNFSPIIKELNR